MKVRQDDFSVYVICKGSIVRPLYRHSNVLFCSRYKRSETINGRHIPQSEMYRVGEELWMRCCASPEMKKHFQSGKCPTCGR